VTDFSAHEDELFMQLLRRRAYMIAFPNEPVVKGDDIQIHVEYQPYCPAVGYHDAEEEVLVLDIGRTEADGSVTWVGIEEASLAEFLRDYFGADSA
jgi:hypothetical protein